MDENQIMTMSIKEYKDDLEKAYREGYKSGYDNGYKDRETEIYG